MSDGETIQFQPPSLVDTSLVEASSKQPTNGGVFCGVYAITNTLNQRMYIGGSVRIIQRWRMHKSQLRHGKHHSIMLQRAWDKYGSKVFSFSVLRTCGRDDVIDLEQQYLDFFKPFYNSRKKVTFIFRGKTSSKKLRKMWSSKKKEMWKDPVYRKSVLDGVRNAEYSEERREKARIQMYSVVHSPENRRKALVASNSKKNSASRRRIMRLKHKDPQWYMKWATSRGHYNLHSFVSPKGEVFKTYNLCGFAKTHGLDSTSLGRLKNHTIKQHKGWTLEAIIETKKP